MKISCLFAAALAAVNLLAAEPVATSVTARQRYPWNGKVDIVVTFSGASNDVAKAGCVFAATNSTTKAALAMAHVTVKDAGTISGSGTTWTRRYVWDAAADLGEVKIADVVLAAEAATPLGGVQLWEGGPHWAECNVGATKPEEYGYYFWWGDTVGYARNASGNGWVSSRTGASFSFLFDNCSTYKKTLTQLQSAGYIDATGNLVAQYDAATAHLGAPWRMPTDAEFAALIDNCTTVWTTRNGVYGRLVTGKGAFSTKSIFLPAAGYGGGSVLKDPGSDGYYWSSTPYSEDSSYAWRLYFGSGYFVRDNNSCYRAYGFPVRPLRGLGAFGVATHLPLDTRTGTRYARAKEPIAFDTAWGENVTQLVLNVDGANALTATTATNGVYVWRPDFSSSRRDVTLKLTLRGAVDEALTATFTTGQPETVTAGGAFFFAPSSDAEFFAVPHDWLVAAGLAHYGDATSGLAAQLAAPYAPGYTGWEAFVAGLTARDQAFRAAVELVDGEIRVSWTPNLNTGTVARIYTVYGRTNLEDGAWASVQPWHRFFKVAVALPTEADGEETAVSGEGFVPGLGGVQLWEGGPYWAECNVGATKPEKYGYSFWWGDTVGYARNASDDDWVSSRTGASFSFESGNCPTYNKTTAQLESAGYIDATGNLVAKYDAATAHLGAPWRMPTDAEFAALIDNCTTTWTTRNGVYGRLVTGKGAFSTKSIFLPAAGYGNASTLYSSGSSGLYWSSTPRSENSVYAWYLFFGSDYFSRFHYYRYWGLPVRPLRGFAK